MKWMIFISSLLLSLASNAQGVSQQWHSIDSPFTAKLLLTTLNDTQTLIYIDLPEHPLHKQVKLYNKVLMNNDLNRYFYQLAGTSGTHLINQGEQSLLHGSLVSYITLQLPNFADIKMVPWQNAHPSDHQRLVDKYAQQQIPAISKIDAKKRLATALQTVQSDCQMTAELDVDWSAFAEAKTLPSMATHYLAALSSICQMDADYQQAVAAIKHISITPSVAGNQTPSLQDGRLSLPLAAQLPNIAETSYLAIMDIL